MKTHAYYKTLRTVPFRLLGSTILGLGILLLPGQSNGQAANSCNLITNPDFEQQKVAQLSGFVDNVKASQSIRDEVSFWQSPGGPGKPDYFATNAPTGSAANPASANQSSWASPFVPYNNNPALHNGAIGIVTGVNNSQGTPFASQESITNTTPVVLSVGKYYASFRAYRSAASQVSTRLGMNLSSTINSAYNGPGSWQSLTDVTNSSWTIVAGQFDITQQASLYVHIGNFYPMSGSSIAQALYYIDEVELYKIPTAGSPASCNGGGSVVIGEGCHIPGATYEWRRNGSTSVISTSASTPAIAVNLTDTYTLKVALPNGTTSSSSVSVTGCNPQPVISGPDYVCVGSNATFTANDGSVIWEAKPAGSFSSASGYGSTFTTSPSANASGQGLITATFYNLTGHPVLTKTVKISALPSTPNFGIVAVPNTNHSSQTYDVAVNNGSNEDYFTLQFTDPNPPYTPAGYNYTRAVYTGPSANTPPIEAQGFTTFHTGLIGPQPNTGPGVTYRMIVTAYGPCGSTSTIKTITLPASGSSGEDPYLVDPTGYPNPAVESLSTSDTQAVLLNSQGKPVAKPNTAGKIDVKSLPAGLYNLRVHRNGKLVNQRIEVKH